MIINGFAKIYTDKLTKNDIVIIKKGYRIIIPPQGIKMTGFIKASVLKAINNLTVENMIKVNKKYGVTFEVLHNCAA